MQKQPCFTTRKRQKNHRNIEIWANKNLHPTHLVATAPKWSGEVRRYVAKKDPIYL